MAVTRRIDFTGWLLIVLVAVGFVGIFYVSGCEANVPLRPEVAEAAGLPPLTADKKPVEVPLSSYPAIEAVYEKKQVEKADAKRTEAATVAADAEVKIVKATRNVAREIRTLQERLEDDTEAVRAQAGLAAKDAEAAIAKINADTASTKAMQALSVQAAREKQAMYDQLKALGGQAFNTAGGIATAASAGTPWGAILPYGLAAVGAIFGFNRNEKAKVATTEAAKANSALDAVTSGIEEAKALPGVPTAALQLVKAEIAKQAQPGDITTIETSIARQNYAAKV